MKINLTKPAAVNSCYFRTSVIPPYKKALIQITERCNLHCAHCFVSAGNYGSIMDIKDVEQKIIPFFIDTKVISVTLTGGEPFFHPNILEIVTLFTDRDIPVTICSNATLINKNQMEYLTKLKNVKVNASLDGFSPESHGKFRGDKASFSVTVDTIKLLSNHNLLKGILVTPNTLANTEEYIELYKFSHNVNAKYVLINPCSRFGRGEKVQDRLTSPNETMNEIRNRINSLNQQTEAVYIRFPNNKFPLQSCEAGNIFYVFTNGDLAICPYLVFAARNSVSKYRAEEFIVGNVLNDTDISEKLSAYNFQERYHLGDNHNCNSCDMNKMCGKGCPAAIISSGNFIEEVDAEICPKVNI